MARIEKTVFISYRRKDISWALAVYQYLTAQKYDVFFDYTHIPSGDFEQIIVGNIKARAHFVLILTPTTLDRCSNPDDWVRREIETAMDEKRNIVPLFFDGFSFGSPNVAEKLTGKLADVKRYNGLDIPSGYFPEAMERLSTRYLNVPLSAVLHPVSTEVKKVVKEEKSAANKALIEQKQEIKELVKPAKEKTEKPKQPPIKKTAESLSPARDERMTKSEDALSPMGKAGGVMTFRPYVLGAGFLLLIALGVLGIRSLATSVGAKETPLQTQTSETVVSSTATSTKPVPTKTITFTPSSVPPTPIPTLGIGSTMTGKDGMILLYVPAGEFVMGSEDGAIDEKPVHTIYLDAFWVDQTEVTNAMFSDYINETGYETDVEKAGTSWIYQNSDWNQVKGADWMHPFGPSSDISDKMNHPVIHVSWNDAQAYCSWVDRRLLTEAEWEKAASWSDLTEEKYVYPWGNDFDCKKNNSDDETQLDSYVVPGDKICDGFPRTSPVGSFLSGASSYGALDMAGNVWEWVNDWYGSSYYQGSPSLNPQGPLSGEGRVLRGGAWFSNNVFVRSTVRQGRGSMITDFSTGFRCARSSP